MNIVDWLVNWFCHDDGGEEVSTNEEIYNPIQVGICKGCDNPIYNWDGDSKPMDFHKDGDDYSCKSIYLRKIKIR